MPAGVGRLRVRAIEVGANVLVAVEDTVTVDQHRDRVGADRAAHRVSPLGIGRHLPRHEVEPQLGQPLADAMGVRAPLCLVELHALAVPARQRMESPP